MMFGLNMAENRSASAEAVSGTDPNLDALALMHYPSLVLELSEYHNL